MKTLLMLVTGIFAATLVTAYAMPLHDPALILSTAVATLSFAGGSESLVLSDLKNDDAGKVEKDGVGGRLFSPDQEKERRRFENPWDYVFRCWSEGKQAICMLVPKPRITKLR